MTITPPKLSYGNGFLYDGDRITGGIEGTWTKTEDGNIGDFLVNSDDYLELAVSGSSGNKIFYVENGTDLMLSSDIYKKIRWRLKCSNANIKAKLVLVFSDGSQTVLDETNNTLFFVGTADITAGKIIDHVQIYANQATGNVYCDFIQIYKGDFEFDNIGGGPLEVDPDIRDAQLDVPGRITDIPNHQGSPSAIVTCSCDLDLGTWKRIDDYIPGQVFLEVSHGHNYAMNYEPWQWLDTKQGPKFKVTIHPRFIYGEDGHHQLLLVFVEYSLANKGGELCVERFGLNT